MAHLNWVGWVIALRDAQEINSLVEKKIAYNIKGILEKEDIDIRCNLLHSLWLKLFMVL